MSCPNKKSSSVISHTPTHVLSLTRFLPLQTNTEERGFGQPAQAQHVGRLHREILRRVHLRVTAKRDAKPMRSLCRWRLCRQFREASRRAWPAGRRTACERRRRGRGGMGMGQGVAGSIARRQRQAYGPVTALFLLGEWAAWRNGVCVRLFLLALCTFYCGRRLRSGLI